jgi:hypothetical protein
MADMNRGTWKPKEKKTKKPKLDRAERQSQNDMDFDSQMADMNRGTWKPKEKKTKKAETIKVSTRKDAPVLKGAKAPVASAPKDAHATKKKTQVKVQDVPVQKSTKSVVTVDTKIPKAKVAPVSNSGKKQIKVTAPVAAPYTNPGTAALKKYREDQAKKKADAAKPVKNKPKAADVVKVADTKVKKKKSGYTYKRSMGDFD